MGALPAAPPRSPDQTGAVFTTDMLAQTLCPFVLPLGVRQPEASWAVVRYLTSPAGLTPFAQIGRTIPPQRSLWSEARPEGDVPASFKHAFLDMWDEIQLEAPFVRHWPDAQAIWREELDPVWLGQRPAKEGAAACQARLDQHLQRLKGEGLL